jgi:hypothetical protein
MMRKVLLGVFILFLIAGTAFAQKPGEKVTVEITEGWGFFASKSTKTIELEHIGNGNIQFPVPNDPREIAHWVLVFSPKRDKVESIPFDKIAKFVEKKENGTLNFHMFTYGRSHQEIDVSVEMEKSYDEKTGTHIKTFVAVMTSGSGGFFNYTIKYTKNKVGKWKFYYSNSDMSGVIMYPTH